MDIAASVWTAMGGSLAGSELRGDYRVARSVATRLRRSSDGASDAGMVAAGLALMMSGWPGRAEHCFSTVLQRRDDGRSVDAGAWARASLYGHYARFLRWWFIPGGGANPLFTETRSRFNVAVALAEMEQEYPLSH